MLVLASRGVGCWCCLAGALGCGVGWQGVLGVYCDWQLERWVLVLAGGSVKWWWWLLAGVRFHTKEDVEHSHQFVLLKDAQVEIAHRDEILTSSNEYYKQQ